MSTATGRVLALLELLQSGGTRTAVDLGERLGVDERTARRYVEHLVELGVPVRSERGRYGGFRLAPGYRMPPLMLTDDEAVAVLLGLVTARRAGLVPVTTPAVESATAKVRRVLPARLQERLEALLEVAAFTSAPRSGTTPETDVLLLAAEAARGHRVLRIGYRDGRGRTTERDVEPSGVVAHSGRWYLDATDRLSGEGRSFRLDRVRSAEVLEDGFEPTAASGRPAEDRLLTHLAEAPRRHAVAVTVEADLAHLRRRVPPGLATYEPTAGGHRVRLQVEDLTWVPSLLAWIDRPFVVEEPAALRAEVTALCDRLASSAAVGA